MLANSQSRGQLREPFISRNTSYLDLNPQKSQEVLEYDPFKHPPNFNLVKMHAKACLVGKIENNEQSAICPCCSNYVDKEKMDINCSDQDLEFLGSAYPLYFRMTIYIIVIILLLFFFGGSLRIFLSNLSCETDCVYFFGLFVIMDQSNEKEQFNGMWYDLLTAIILMIAVLIIKPLIANNINDFNETFLDPASYTIAMKNLPLNTRKQDIEKFFAPILKDSKNTKDTKNTSQIKKIPKIQKDPKAPKQEKQPLKIEKIHFIYSVDQYLDAYNQKIKCITNINLLELQIKDSFQDEGKKPKLLKKLELEKEKLNQQEQLLDNFQKECEVEGSTENFTGTAFVTFNNQKIIKPIISEWGNSTRKSIWHFLFGWYSSPYQDFNGNPLIITRAPTPRDVKWENQRFSFLRTYTNNTLMIAVAVSILFSSFYLQYVLMKIVYPYRKSAGQDFGKRLQAYMMSLIVVIVNTVLRMVVMYFTIVQKYDSQVRFNQSYINRYVVLLFLNSAFMPYLIHKRWDDDIQVSSNLLLQDITFLFLTNAFSEPLAKIFNVFWIYRIYMRKVITGYDQQTCPYTQSEANSWHEGPSFIIANSYAFIARTLFLCTWYASVSPYGLIFSLIGLIFNYYVDRVLLLRYCSCPETQNEDIFTEVIATLPLLPIIYVCGVIQFQNRSKLDVNENLFVFFGQYFEYGLTSVAMFVSFVGYIILNNFKKNENEKFNDRLNIQYEDATEYFITQYEMVNPITASKYNMEWTKALNKKRANNTVGNTMAAAQNRNSRYTTTFQFGNQRTSTFLTRNSSVTQLQAFRQRLPEDNVNHRLPLTSSQKELELFTFK